MALRGVASGEQFLLALATTSSSQLNLAASSSRVHTVSDLIQSLRSIPNIIERASAQTQLLEVANNHSEFMGEVLAEILDWVLSDPLVAQAARGFLPLPGSTQGTPVDQLIGDQYPSFMSSARQGQRTRNNKRSYRATVQTQWGLAGLNNPTIVRLMEIENVARGIADLSKAYPDFEAAQLRMNGALVSRLSKTGRGIRKEKRYLRSDMDKAGRRSFHLPTTTAEVVAQAAQYGLALGRDGFLSDSAAQGEPQSPRFPRAEIAPASPSLLTSQLSQTSISQSQQSPRGSPKPSSQYGTSRPSSHYGTPPQYGSQYGSQYGTQRGSPQGTPTPAPGTSAFAQPSQSHIRSSSSSSRGSRGALGGSGEASSPMRGSEHGGTPTPSTHARQRSILGSSPLSAIDESVLRSPPASLAKGILRCRCDFSRASTNVLLRLKYSTAIRTQEEQIRLLGSFIRPLSASTDIDAYCYPHLRVFSQAMGLRVADATAKVLTERLWAMWTEGRHDLGAFRVRRDRYVWFQKAARGPVPSDELGPYRYFQRSNLPSFFTIDKGSTLQAIATALKFSLKQRDEWHEKGTIRVSGLFDFWKEPVGDSKNPTTILDMAKEEYRMYAWHLRRINDRANYGWARNMVYSLTQQLVRQDPSYWLLYVLLRPDHRGWLISYPYYTKCQFEGDKTAFKHIDVNIPGMIGKDKRGLHQIQGTVSFDDEKGDDCTILVPGMHRHIVDWGRALETRGLKGGYVHKITDDLLTPADLQKYKTQWEAVPCKALDVRVTHPAIPHGAQGPAKRVRRTMLPWFVGIDKRHQNLDVAEAGSWAELADAHRAFTAPKTSPSGFPNMYGAIPYAFPAAVQLNQLGPISDALVGRRLWTDVEVVEQQSRLFYCEDPARAIADYLRAWRERAAQRFIEKMELVKHLERTNFPKGKSFYWCGGDASRQPKADDAYVDDQDDEDDAEGAGGAVELEQPMV